METDHSLSAMPEEMLVMIFRECFTEKTMKLSIHPRLQSPKTLFEDPTQETPPKETLDCMNVLFVCKVFHRIALPHFYATVTFLWDRFMLKKANFLQRPDFCHVKPLDRLRNLYCRKQQIGCLEIDDTSKLGFLGQLNTFRIETKVKITNGGTFSSKNETIT